jgi:predicted Rossmann-fold nucleotide-binding protein
VAVIGSGRDADAQCADAGRLIAALGFDLLTGGGRGVMEAVSRAFFETSPRQGVVIGVVPARVHPIEALEQRNASDVEYDLPPGYPNDWVEIAIYTHLPDSGDDGALRSSRNHINVLSADAIVAMPGREGTESEVWLARQYGVPIVGFGEHPKGPPFGIAHARSVDELSAFLKPYGPA